MNLDVGAVWQNPLHAKSGQRMVPNVFIRGEHIVGCSDVLKVSQEAKLLPMIEGDAGAATAAAAAEEGSDLSYDYDFIVIGGGLGGLLASKVEYKRVKIILTWGGYFVQPTPQGITWTWVERASKLGAYASLRN